MKLTELLAAVKDMHSPLAATLGEMTLAVVWAHLLIIALVKLLRSPHLRDLRGMTTSVVADLSSRFWIAMGRRQLSPSGRRAAAIFDLFFDYAGVSLFGLSAVSFFAAFVQSMFAADHVAGLVFGVYALGTTVLTKMFVEHARRDRSTFYALWYPKLVRVTAA